MQTIERNRLWITSHNASAPVPRHLLVNPVYDVAEPSSIETDPRQFLNKHTCAVSRRCQTFPLPSHLRFPHSLTDSKTGGDGIKEEQMIGWELVQHMSFPQGRNVCFCPDHMLTVGDTSKTGFRLLDQPGPPSPLPPTPHSPIFPGWLLGLFLTVCLFYHNFYFFHSQNTNNKINEYVWDDCCI